MNYKSRRKGFKDRSSQVNDDSGVLVSRERAVKLGYRDNTELSDQTRQEVKDFLQSWGILPDDYSLLGVLVFNKNNFEYRPVIVKQTSKVAEVIRESRFTERLENLAQIRYAGILSPEVIRRQGDKVLVSRQFLSNTLGDVYKMTSGFPLERLVNVIRNVIRTLCFLHKSGISHGSLSEWNISVTFDHQGVLVDPSLEDQSASMSQDLYDLGKIIETAFYKVRVDKSEVELKQALGDILKPLILSLKDEDESKRPSAFVALGLYTDLICLIKPELIVKDPEDDYLFRDINESAELSDEKIKISRSNVSESLQFDNSLEDISDMKEHSLKNESINPRAVNFVFYSFIIIASLILGYLVFNRVAGYVGIEKDYQLDSILTQEELVQYWNSGLTSKLKEVAKQAVYLSPARGDAEEVIVSPILLDKNVIKVVDSALIRVAYAKEWEPYLSESDRRFVLALALRDILGGEFPKDLPQLDKLHPAVLLAVLSNLDQRISGVLNNVSAISLTELPEPFGVAFQVLFSGRSEVNASSEEVIQLAHLGTRGVDDPLLLTRYLSADFEKRLSALAIMYSLNTSESLKVIDVILNHPNVAMHIANAEWARKVDLVNWEGVDANDKLFLIAGVSLRPEKVLTPPQIARLFMHPASSIRGYASGLAINQIQFKHKASLDILTMIRKVPDLITADQLTLLGQILEDPEKTFDSHISVAKNFIASEPPIEIAKVLLLADNKAINNSMLDTALTSYLLEKGWVPDAEEINLLISHVNKVARLYGYQVVFSQQNKQHAKEVLSKSLGIEKEADAKEQLEAMLKQIK